MKYNVTTESPTNLTKELGIDNLGSFRGFRRTFTENITLGRAVRLEL